MNATLRRSLSAVAWVAAVALALGGAASTALSLRDARANVESLRSRLDALAAREKRAALHSGRDSQASPLFEARTITLAGAALQQRVETAVATAHGRLVSSKLDVSPNGDKKGITIAAELTIGDSDLQLLLFDLETGRPYLFVDAFETRPAGADGGGEMRVSLNVSGQWGAEK